MTRPAAGIVGGDMAKKCRVAQVGLGNRGTVHANAFLSLKDRFEIVGLCELKADRLKEYAREKRLPGNILFPDAEEMLKSVRPDVFCFVTGLEPTRKSFVEMAARHGVKTIALEKPMARDIGEAREIVRLCRENGIRGVVSHQQKYLTSFQKMREIIDRGDIGEVHLLLASCQAWLAQLGTHFVDLALWLNGFDKARWVAGHVHGRELLSDSHPSPNYTAGQIGFANGVRCIVEFGRLSKSNLGPEDVFWFDSRLTAYGTHGYVWAETNGRWGALTKKSGGEPVEEQGDGWMKQEPTRLQPLYLAELADWLDGKISDHSCNIEHAYEGYEIMHGLCVSALDNVRLDLPLKDGLFYDVFERMKKELPECPEREPKRQRG